MSTFTIEKITQKDIKPTMERNGSLLDHHQQTFDTMLPNLGFLQNEPSPFHQNISPEKTVADERTTSPISSTSSSPRTPDSQGGGSPDDKTMKKPQHSYIALIALAILDSPDKRLLLCDIYSFIQTNFPYYRNNDRSWRNSIRHNLSLNECFIKCGRSGDGRGNFWGIHPANIEDFARGDYRRRRARRRVRAAHELSSYLYHPYSAPIAAATAYSASHIPVGFVPMSCTSFPPYSVVPPAPFYPPPVSVPFTIPHVMQRPSSYSSAFPAAAPVTPINSISAPISSSSSLQNQLRRSPDIIPVSPSVSPPSASPPHAYPPSCELSKTVQRPMYSSGSNLHVPVTSAMFTLPYNPTAVSSLSYQPHWDRSALHPMYSA